MKHCTMHVVMGRSVLLCGMLLLLILLHSVLGSVCMRMLLILAIARLLDATGAQQGSSSSQGSRSS